MWGRLLTCGPIANRPAWRLPGCPLGRTQLGKPPHNLAWLFANDRLANDLHRKVAGWLALTFHIPPHRRQSHRVRSTLQCRRRSPRRACLPVKRSHSEPRRRTGIGAATGKCPVRHRPSERPADRHSRPVVPGLRRRSPRFEGPMCRFVESTYWPSQLTRVFQSTKAPFGLSRQAQTCSS